MILEVPSSLCAGRSYIFDSLALDECGRWRTNQELNAISSWTVPVSWERHRDGGGGNASGLKFRLATSCPKPSAMK